MSYLTRFEGTIDITPKLFELNKSYWFLNEDNELEKDCSCNTSPFYKVVEELELIAAELGTLGFTLNGNIGYIGEEFPDMGVIQVTNNNVKVYCAGVNTSGKYDLDVNKL